MCAWDGNGTYTRTNGTNTGSETWQDDATAGTKILASRHDVHDEDLATAISACLTQNNESKPTAHFTPNVDSTYDLGTTSVRWRTAYVDSIDSGGDVVGTNFVPSASVSPGDPGNVGASAVNGLILTGQGSVNDITITNDTATSVITIPTGTFGVNFAGDITVTGDITGSNKVLRTMQASTSGSTIGFGSIPSWAKKITVMLSAVSTDGTEPIQVQIGYSGGYETSGYVSGVNDTASLGSSSTTGFHVCTGSPAHSFHGHVTLTMMDSATFKWIASGVIYEDGGETYLSAGSKSLTGALISLRVSCGSDAFDAGNITIMYE